MKFDKDMLKHIYIEVFPAADFAPEDIDCFFVLSTGRCGTLTLDRILSLSPNIASFHEPMPRLHEWHIPTLHGRDVSPLYSIVKASRIDIMSAMMSMGYKYSECQHRWTPYAPVVKRIFPKAKFIYLRRNMDDFVRSALLWHYYDVGKAYAPPDIRDDEGKMLAWFWCVTNEYIINFLSTIPEEDQFYLSFDDLVGPSWTKLTEMFKWMKSEPPWEGRIALVLNEKLNKGRPDKIEKGWGDFDGRSEKIYRSYEV